MIVKFVRTYWYGTSILVNTASLWGRSSEYAEYSMDGYALMMVL